MEAFSKSFNFVFMVCAVLNVGKVSGSAEIYGLMVKPIRSDQDLKLHVWWNTTLPDSTNYHVTATHIDSETCTLKDSPFQNNKLIKCAPIVASAKTTEVIIPENDDGYYKHICPIQSHCTYLIEVEPMSSSSKITNIVQVPDCVEGLCSCYYAEHLPALVNTSAVINRTTSQLIVSWALGTFDETDLPENVTLKAIHIGVRRGTNNDLGWGGLHSSMKELALPIGTGTHSFDINEFAGSKFIFVIQLKVIDTRDCEHAAVPLRVTLPDSAQRLHNTTVGSKVQTPPSKSILLPILFALLAVSIAVAIASCIFIYYKRRTKFRWKANNWRGVYVRSSGDHHPQVAMEENRLYVDMEILNARARGDADYLEVPHSCLRIGREIGKGAFGRVFMASAVKLPGLNGPKIVAIKQLKKCSSSDEFDEFLDEITMMKKVGKHPNIVALLGCCTIKEPLTMIMEYVGCGDLLEYLRKIRAKHLAKVHQLEVSSQLENASAVQSTTPVSNIFGPMVKYLDLLHTSSSTSDASYITQTDTATRPSVTETTYTMLSGTMGDEDNSSTLGSCSLEYVLDHKELHNFAKQIAFGMEHLEELQITHRDLAARNILIDERKTLKISDFGLSRTGIYVNTRNKKVPLRWLSIEAMRDNLYSNKSDVWAFGIVLWEIGTLGGYPYPSVSNHELFAYLQEGKRLERPENCTAEVYDLMLQCWREDPNERPSFKQISKHLQPHKKIYIDFNEIEPTYVFPPTSDQLRLAIANNK
ncbi:vascular endothelial growth factor receptor 1 isoform X3 [Anopheles funestus]|uniref:vascular endothelial growth factor receptor 1 isoform X3 n=1 Tax=Anopheles funestus TaxID=62324 RepID=UPI0020C68E48|nr:vascular endothelial growth factor receptor 1 isoform X3 [Anopheles funestus]